MTSSGDRFSAVLAVALPILVASSPLEAKDSGEKERASRLEPLQVSANRSTDPATPPPNDPKGEEGTDLPPGQVVVEEEAERALERSMVQVGALLLRPGRVELDPSLRYARQEDEIPTFISLNGTTTLWQRKRNVDDLTADLELRLGLPWDSQLEVGVPYHWRRVEDVRKVGSSGIQYSDRSGTGLGNVRIGLAKTLLREGGWRPDLVGRVGWNSRSGTDQDGGVRIASDFNRVQGALTAIQRQAPLVFLGSVAYEHVLERKGVQPGSAIKPTLGTFLALSPETSMRFLFSQTFRQETEVNGTDVPGSDQRAATFTVGGFSQVTGSVFLNLSVGLGLTDDAEAYSVRLGVPIRF